MRTIDGTQYLAELIKELSQNRNSSNYIGNFTVSALVEGKKKVFKDTIKCQLTILHDSVDVSIFWEDCGYKGFRDMGLYGRTNSKYFTVQQITDSSFQITDDNNTSNQTIFEW